ncbi:MAG TPA: DUF2911 domain-containing protein [Flavitalea sp.]|nr:DUF2911 domain-containing protein [Flavitalea sp.]
MFFSSRYSLLLSLLLFTIISCRDNTRAPLQQVNIEPASVQTQEKKRASNMDKSPMDIAYYPEDFPVLKMSGKATGEPVARIIYSRPFKDGREIFGNVVKYGTYWRLGANEGTEIEFFRDVSVMGRPVRRGRYIIYTIPYKNKWTIKLNSDLYSWGLSIHSAKDVYSFDIPVATAENNYEVLTIKFESKDKGAQLMMAWDTVKTYLPFTY